MKEIIELLTTEKKTNYESPVEKDNNSRRNDLNENKMKIKELEKDKDKEKKHMSIRGRQRLKLS